MNDRFGSEARFVIFRFPFVSLKIQWPAVAYMARYLDVYKMEHAL